MLVLAMTDQLAPSYKSLAEGWQGHLLIIDMRDGTKWLTGPEDVVHVGETKVFIQWEGRDPTGVMIPVDAVRIEQHHGGSDA